MASTPTRFVHCGTGGLEELSSSSGTVTAQATIKKSGDYAYKLAVNSGAEIIKVMRDSNYVSGDAYCGAFWIRFSDVSPSTEYSFFGYSTGDGTGDNVVQLRLKTNGDVEAKKYDNSASFFTITAPLTANTWHYFKIDYVYHDTAGSLRVTIDGSATGEATSIDTAREQSRRSAKWSGSVAAGDGDVYVDCAAEWDCTEYKPTDIPDDIAKSDSYQSAHTTATDLGDALDTGNWDDVGELPFSDTNTAEIVTNNAAGGTDFDDGARAGPSGNFPSGTVLAGEVLFRAKRSNGSGNDHTFYAGSSADTWPTGLVSIVYNLNGDFDAWPVSLTAAQCPTSSEYFRAGFGKASGGKDPTVADMVGILLYEPTAAGGRTNKIVIS